MPGNESGHVPHLHVLYNREYNSILTAISLVDCLIILIGTLGNSVAYCVLKFAPKHLVPNSCYIKALCVADVISLYGWYFSSVYRQLFGGQVRRIENLSLLTCRLIPYVSLCSLQISSLILCMLTIDRFCLIVNPQRRLKPSTTKLSLTTMRLLLLFILALNSMVLFRVGNQGVVNYEIIRESANLTENELSYHQSELIEGNVSMVACYNDSDPVYAFWLQIHLFLYSLIPTPILCVLNVIVIKETLRAVNSQESEREWTRTSKANQQTAIKLLLILSIAFLVTTLPSTLLYAFWHSYILRLDYGRVLLNLLNTLQFSRHATNWIIYFYSSYSMRNQFKSCAECLDLSDDWSFKMPGQSNLPALIDKDQKGDADYEQSFEPLEKKSEKM
nr:G protein-coupled receptor [Proales similis]